MSAVLSRGVQFPKGLVRIFRRFDHRNAGCVEEFMDKQKNGAVAICVGIDFGAISSVTRLPDHAARSIA